MQNVEEVWNTVLHIFKTDLYMARCFLCEFKNEADNNILNLFMVWDIESKVWDVCIVIWKKRTNAIFEIKETVFSITAEDGSGGRLIVYKTKDNKNFEFVSNILNYKEISSKLKWILYIFSRDQV